MKNPKFTTEEIEALCNLYMEGQLSIAEEKALLRILIHNDDLSASMKGTLDVMNAEKDLYGGKEKRKRNKFKLYTTSIAASLIVVAGVAIAVVFLTRASIDDAHYTVWLHGVELNDEDAQRLAEKNQQEDMDLIRDVMRQKRELMKQNFASVDSEEINF